MKIDSTYYTLLVLNECTRFTVFSFLLVKQEIQSRFFIMKVMVSGCLSRDLIVAANILCIIKDRIKKLQTIDYFIKSMSSSKLRRTIVIKIMKKSKAMINYFFKRIKDV